MMSPEQLLRRIAAGNMSIKTASIDSGLVIAEFGHTRLGDILQAFTNLRYLSAHLGIRCLDVNLPDPSEYRLGAEILRGNSLVRHCSNLRYCDIPYRKYQTVLHYTVFKDSEIVRWLAETYDELIAASDHGIAFYSVPASIWDLKDRYGPSWGQFVYPFPPVDVPRDLLKDAAGDHCIRLSPEELAWAEQWLTQAGVRPYEKLIVFIDDASVREKVLHPLCYFRILEHFLSIDGVKVLVYDVRALGKQDVYREVLGARSFSKMIFSTRNGLRKDLALLAAPCVKMILGPDTGMMHCAAGIYSGFASENRRIGADRPLILVYAGRWRDFNMWDFWGNSAVCCLILHETESGKILRPLYECPREDPEFLDGLAEVSSLPADVLIECLETRFGEAMRVLGLLRGS